MRTMMKMTYRVKLFNDFTEPYWTSNDPENSSLVDYKNSEEYVAYDEETFKNILYGFIDAPKKKLTDKEIRRDFDENHDPKMSDDAVNMIKAYYNGRLELKKKIDADLAKFDMHKIKKNFPVMLKYKIPFEMNHFSCDDNDPCSKLTKMNDAYIEIEISNME